MRIDAPKYVGAEAMSVDKQQSMVTKWGAFMRKTSIDELPQLFNILRGDMSFIGPRPCFGKHKEAELVSARLSYYPNAYEVKPGLSGYSQIHMKRDHDIYKKAKFDSYYVKHLGLWFDIKIFVYSFAVLFGFAKGR